MSTVTIQPNEEITVIGPDGQVFHLKVTVQVTDDGVKVPVVECAETPAQVLH